MVVGGREEPPTRVIECRVRDPQRKGDVAWWRKVLVRPSWLAELDEGQTKPAERLSRVCEAQEINSVGEGGKKN